MDGIIAVPATPFTDDDRVDIESLRRYVSRSIAQGVVGFAAPPVAACGDDWCPVFPSPPPIGWSTGFFATPRTCGRTPNHRLLPAFPRVMFS